MSNRLQIILLSLLVLVFLLLVNQVRKKVVELKYTLSWIILDLVLIVLTCFPKLLIVMSESLGITSPINMIFFCGFVVSLIIIYTLTVALSRNAERIRNLTQSVALNEYRTRKEEEKKK